jgi:lipid-A-disaccharide synthase-like uncharacterized protein
MTANLAHWWQATPTSELIWIGVGLTAQLMFSMRFIVQWWRPNGLAPASSPKPSGISVFSAVPCCCARYRLDPVFMLGQATGLVIYSRNLYFIWLGKRALSPVKLV